MGFAQRARTNALLGIIPAARLGIMEGSVLVQQQAAQGAESVLLEMFVYLVLVV